MTRVEFKQNVPGLIRHKSHGVQYLEIREGSESLSAFYAGDDNVTSFSVYAQSWDQLHQKMKNVIKNSMDILDDPAFHIPNQK